MTPSPRQIKPRLKAQRLPGQERMLTGARIPLPLLAEVDGFRTVYDYSRSDALALLLCIGLGRLDLTPPWMLPLPLGFDTTSAQTARPTVLSIPEGGRQLVTTRLPPVLREALDVFAATVEPTPLPLSVVLERLLASALGREDLLSPSAAATSTHGSEVLAGLEIAS